MNKELKWIKSNINKLISENKVVNYTNARVSIEDAYAHNEIDTLSAIGLCMIVAHGLCQLDNLDESAQAEIELGYLRMFEQYNIVGKTWKDQEQNVCVLLNDISTYSDQKINDYISIFYDAFLSLPGHFTKLGLLLSLQAELVLVVLRYRVDLHLNEIIDEQDKTIAGIAYDFELALFESLIFDPNSIIWEDIHESDTPESIK